jgi:hypothetical protein
MASPTDVSAQALDQDVREHFDRLYDALWRLVLGVVGVQGHAGPLGS